MRRTVVALVLMGALVAPAAASQRASVGAPMDRAVRVARGNISVLVHARAGRLAPVVRAARAAGLVPGSRYESIDVFVAYGSASLVRTLAKSDGVEYIEPNRRLSYFTESSHEATRGQNVLDGAITMPNGNRIDGRGVGVAVVDSGIDGTHPDLVGQMGGNVKTVCSTPQFVGLSATGGFTTCLGPKTFVPVTDSDTPSAGGHGTHVAGIIAGDGTASKERFHGAAPGATLYGVSIGTAVFVENALDGLEWVLENHDRVKPAIKVVNNSWGGEHRAYDPGDDPFKSATWKLQEELVADGVTVVFAAGNAGGDGSEATTSAECINPTPGIICVANYNDSNTGTRDGSIWATSSRGEKGDPLGYPDLAAPGTNIMSTCRVTLLGCWTNNTPPVDPLYTSKTGTSMAAPHVTGIIAQLYQAHPGLSPAQVENVLEDTAWKNFGSGQYEPDPFNGNSTTSYDRGHGLVDALAAIQAVL